jgi:hypothetical protein
MRKIDLGQTIQILANIGVIAGIIFLGVELRQNNRLSAAQAEYNLLQYQTNFASPPYQNPEIIDFILSARQKASSGEELTGRERFRVRRLLDLRVDGWQWRYFQNRAGALREMDALKSEIAFTFNGGAENYGASEQEFLDYWNNRSRRMNPEFVQFVDTVTDGQ